MSRQLQTGASIAGQGRGNSERKETREGGEWEDQQLFVDAYSKTQGCIYQFEEDSSCQHGPDD